MSDQNRNTVVYRVGIRAAILMTMAVTHSAWGLLTLVRRDDSTLSDVDTPLLDVFPAQAWGVAFIISAMIALLGALLRRPVFVNAAFGFGCLLTGGRAILLMLGAVTLSSDPAASLQQAVIWWSLAIKTGIAGVVSRD